MTRKHSQFTLILLGLIVLGLAIIALGGYLLHRQMMATQELNKEYTALVKQKRAVEADIKKLDEFEAELKLLETKLASMDLDMVDYKYLPTYLRQLQMTAAETGNVIRSIRPREIEALNENNPLLVTAQNYAKKLELNAEPIGSSSAKAAPKETPAKEEPAKNTASKGKGKGASEYLSQQFTLEVDGTYVSIMRFLDVLRTFPKMVYVRAINISPRVDEEDLSVKVSARIETYAIIAPQQYQPGTARASAPEKEGVTP